MTSPSRASERLVAARLIESAEERNAWHLISESADAGQMQQCFWWSDPLKKAGVRSKGIGIWTGERLVGGGLFRSIPLPCVGAHMTQCLAGPLHLDWHPEWADHFVSQVDELAQADNSVEVAIHGCASHEAHRDIVYAFLRRGSRISVSPGAHEALLSLEGTTLEKIWDGMSEGTRRNIRKAMKNQLHVRELKSGLELKSAHDAWLATAQRKRFSDVRPWELLEPVLRHCVDKGLGSVYATFAEGRMLAAIFVTRIGGQASYVYGGFFDGGERYSPNHLLHHEAIKRCFEMGMKSYNFGLLTPDFDGAGGGLDQFKLGFGARPKRKPDSIIWRRRPLLANCLERLRKGRAGRRLVEEFRRRLLARRRPSPDA